MTLDTLEVQVYHIEVIVGYDIAMVANLGRICFSQMTAPRNFRFSVARHC